MSAIIWPEGYLPGFTDNFASNEVIAAGLSAADIFPLLEQAHLWPSYYANSANIRLHNPQERVLRLGSRFYFETFGFPIEAEVVEYAPPASGQPARIAWHGWAGEGATRLDVHHAWLVEDLPQGRVRILTQETQNGNPAKELAKTRPNPMLNGHQLWLDGLLTAAGQRKGRK